MPYVLKNKVVLDHCCGSSSGRGSIRSLLFLSSSNKVEPVLNDQDRPPTKTSATISARGIVFLSEQLQHSNKNKKMMTMTRLNVPIGSSPSSSNSDNHNSRSDFSSPRPRGNPRFTRNYSKSSNYGETENTDDDKQQAQQQPPVAVRTKKMPVKQDANENGKESLPRPQRHDDLPTDAKKHSAPAAASRKKGSSSSSSPPPPPLFAQCKAVKRIWQEECQTPIMSSLRLGECIVSKMIELKASTRTELGIQPNFWLSSYSCARDKEEEEQSPLVAAGNDECHEHVQRVCLAVASLINQVCCMADDLGRADDDTEEAAHDKVKEGWKHMARICYKYGILDLTVWRRAVVMVVQEQVGGSLHLTRQHKEAWNAVLAFVAYKVSKYAQKLKQQRQQQGQQQQQQVAAAKVVEATLTNDLQSC